MFSPPAKKMLGQAAGEAVQSASLESLKQELHEFMRLTSKKLESIKDALESANDAELSSLCVPDHAVSSTHSHANPTPKQPNESSVSQQAAHVAVHTQRPKDTSIGKESTARAQDQHARLEALKAQVRRQLQAQSNTSSK